MTVKDYAAHIGKSIPLVYKRIYAGQLAFETKFGKIVIKVKQ